jgi:phage/plasmid-like protein (TIGR03299 family)
MFSVRRVPWHRLGDVIDQHPRDWAEARKLAGLEWEPITEPVYALHGVDNDGQPVYQPVDGWSRIARSDTAATLAVTRDSYTLIDHAAMGEIVEAVMDQPGVRWETAGVLDGGRAVWCLAELDQPITLPGDNSPTMAYVAITNRHDGTAACTLRATAIRIVCANTFRAAELEGERTGLTFSFRHSKGWRDRVQDARDAITGARREVRAYVDLAEHLLGVRVSAAQVSRFVTEFIPMPPDGLISDRVVSNVDRARKSLRDILASPTTAEISHTAYGLVQAAGEYLDHVRAARSWETRLGRTIMRPEPLKAKALTLVRAITTNA